MNKQFIFTILIAVIGIVMGKLTSVNEKDMELVQLIELARHGSRAPFYDLFDFKTNWNIPLKTLTDVGMRQHYLIGQELYRRFHDTIFSNVYSSNEVSVLSTSSDRAQQSALCQMYGIYQERAANMSSNWKFQASTDLPPMHVTDGRSILEKLNGRNLPNSYEPVNVLLGDNPVLLESYNVCPGFDVLKALNFKTDIFKMFDDSLAEFKVQFVKNFNLDKNPASVTIQNIADYWDSVICDIYQQIPLPSTFDKIFVQKMQFVYDFQQLYLNFNSSNGNLVKLQTTTFMNDVIDVITNQQQIKFKFYSASDGNLNAILIATGYASYTTDFNEWLYPTTSQTHSNAPFSSTIFFYVYKQKLTQQKYIKMTYNDHPILIKGCKHHLCHFETEFLPAISDLTIVKQDLFQNLCQNGN